jgi:hypothetical protein
LRGWVACSWLRGVQAWTDTKEQEKEISKNVAQWKVREWKGA